MGGDRQGDFWPGNRCVAPFHSGIAPNTGFRGERALVMTHNFYLLVYWALPTRNLPNLAKPLLQCFPWP